MSAQNKWDYGQAVNPHYTNLNLEPKFGNETCIALEVIQLFFIKHTTGPLIGYMESETLDVLFRYIKTNHEVMLQKNLSRDRPCYTSKQVDCPFKLKQIVCQSGVVWALTEEFQWLYREGVTKKHPEGNSWKKGVR